MVQANITWTKQALPSTKLAPPKGCAMRATDYAELSAVPEAYELLIGCPKASDISVYYSQINWSKLVAAGWKYVPTYGTYGTASKAYAKFYVYPGYSPEGCWAYVDLFKQNTVFGITAYCDQTGSGTTQREILTSAEQWTAAVLHQILHVQKPPAKQVTI
jgi:hypothetical protein